MPDAGTHQRRQPPRDLEAGPIRVCDGGLYQHGAGPPIRASPSGVA
jgi:hypothetical protein